MTFEEAKKILENEFVEIGFHKSTEPFEFDESRWFVGEKPEVLDAFRVLSKEGYYIAISRHDYDMRKARLGRPTDKPSSDTPSTLNPALKEAASEFNDALLDEQAKKIKRLGREIARLNKIIHKKNLKIEELGKESSRHLKGKMKMFGENFDLEQTLKDKDAVLADVAEELRLSKVREENLTEVCMKYLKEIEELREKLADKVVDKIDTQALKSAESALAYKEKVIAEKNEVIADLGKELKAKKDLVDDISLKYDGAKHNLKLRMITCEKLDEEIEKLQKKLEEKTKLVEVVRNASKEYCDYGVTANEFIKELAGLYVLANNSGIINNEMFERCKNYQTYGFPANCGRETKKEINDIASGKENKKRHIPTPEISQEELMKIQEKVVASCDIAEEGGDHSGAVVLCGKDFVKKLKENYDFFHDLFEKKNKEIAEFMFIESGHLGGNGILDQMEDSNHPTEDTPEEVDMDEVLERVRKALDEGHTVSIDYKD